jgi:NTP pyrophosphatase (non-canonical NTP hydrolase)
MEINNLQKRCVDVVRAIDKKYDLDRDKYLTFTQLVEEIGELGREVNTPKLRNKEVDYENLKGEFADVILQLATLADILNIDLMGAVDSKIEVLKERHKMEF